jgi:hypothetical protein
MGFDNSTIYQAAVDKWQRDMEAVHNKAELLLKKQRHVPKGKIDLFFEDKFACFANLIDQALGRLNKEGQGLCLWTPLGLAPKPHS